MEQGEHLSISGGSANFYSNYESQCSPIIGQGGSHKEPAGHTNWGLPGNRILPFSICSMELLLWHHHTQILLRENWSPRSVVTPTVTGETTTTIPILGPIGICQETIGHWNHGAARDRIFLVSIGTLQLSTPKSWLETAGLPGVLTPKITGSPVHWRDKHQSEIN